MAGMTLRRLRANRHLQAMLREVRPDPAQFIQPLFVVEGLRAREAVPSLTGVFRDTTDSLLAQIETDLRAGLRSFLLFGVPADRRERDFRHAFSAAQIAAVKRRFGADLWLAVDVCLCSYTSHGHCGILDDDRSHVDNHATVDALAAAAAEYAAAGADCVAPSDMMDGRIAAIRAALDARADDRTVLMSYAAKFHSGFYGPFRVAADSTPRADESALADRSTYQLDPGRPRDALASARRDADEGADILMVKPGLPYLDVLAELSHQIQKPWAVYQTSGEQAALELLAGRELADLERVQLETWTAFCRAGADIIISYAARRAPGWLSR